VRFTANVAADSIFHLHGVIRLAGHNFAISPFSWRLPAARENYESILRKRVLSGQRQERLPLLRAGGGEVVGYRRAGADIGFRLWLDEYYFARHYVP
jgi:hypothetical protein